MFAYSVAFEMVKSLLFDKQQQKQILKYQSKYVCQKQMLRSIAIFSLSLTFQEIQKQQREKKNARVRQYTYGGDCTQRVTWLETFLWFFSTFSFVWSIVRSLLLIFLLLLFLIHQKTYITYLVKCDCGRYAYMYV